MELATADSAMRMTAALPPRDPLTWGAGSPKSSRNRDQGSSASPRFERGSPRFRRALPRLDRGLGVSLYLDSPRGSEATVMSTQAVCGSSREWGEKASPRFSCPPLSPCVRGPNPPVVGQSPRRRPQVTKTRGSALITPSHSSRTASHLHRIRFLAGSGELTLPEDVPPARILKPGEFTVSQLEGRYLAYILHTYLPSVGVSLEVLEGDHLKAIRKAALLNTRLERLRSGGSVCDVSRLAGVVTALGREVHAVKQKADALLGVQAAFSTASRSIRDDQCGVTVVPHFGSYYGLAMEIDPQAAFICLSDGGANGMSMVRDMFPFLLSHAPSLASSAVTALRQTYVKVEELLECYSETPETVLAVYVADAQVNVLKAGGGSRACVVSIQGGFEWLTDITGAHAEPVAADSPVASGGSVNLPSLHHTRIRLTDVCLVVASGELWDVMSPEQVAQVLVPHSHRRDSRMSASSPHRRAYRMQMANWLAEVGDNVATVLMEEAISMGASDGISVAVIPLAPHQ